MSSQQTERVLATISTQAARPEKARALNEEETEIGFTVSRALMRKMKKLQNPMGLRVRTQTYAGLFEELANMGLKKLDLNQKTDLRLKKEDSLPPVEVVSPACLF
jgi:hypothetical protein